MNRVLLTVSGVIPADIQAQVVGGARPEADYLAMARAFPADLMDYPAARRAGGWFGRFLERLGGPNLALAWACFRQRRRYPVIFTDGEQVGLPLALLFLLAGGRRRPRHVMIAHLLSARKKVILVDLFRLHRQIDRFLTYSTWQQRFIRERWMLPDQQVVFTPFMVDARFFDPSRATEQGTPEAFDPQGRPVICAVGLEFRDYPTLLEAVHGLDAHVVIAAASPWSKRSDTTAGKSIPKNVTVRRFSQYELRDLYAASRLVVMPLYSVDFQAGVTAILEAMAMERPVICSRTPGQTDIILAGETGLYVPPADPKALRTAIQELLSRPEHAARLGVNGRRRVLEWASLDCYLDRLQSILREFAPER